MAIASASSAPSACLSRLLREAQPTRSTTLVEWLFKTIPCPKCTSIIDGDMAPETAGELVCNLGFDCPGESHCKDKLAGVKLRFLRQLSSGIGRRISTVSADNCAGKMASFGWPKSFCQPGSIGLANSTAMSRQTTPSWQVKSVRDSQPHAATISPVFAAVSACAFNPQPGAKAPPPSLPKRAARRQTTYPGHQGK